MKRILISMIGGAVIYGLLGFLCSYTGSGILSSGPLDWLFNILIAPGLFFAENLVSLPDAAIGILCWLTYIIIFGVIIYGFLTFTARKKSTSNA